MMEEAGSLWIFRKDACEAAILQLIVETENEPDWESCEEESSRQETYGKCK